MRRVHEEDATALAISPSLNHTTSSRLRGLEVVSTEGVEGGRLVIVDRFRPKAARSRLEKASGLPKYAGASNRVMCAIGTSHGQWRGVYVSSGAADECGMGGPGLLSALFRPEPAHGRIGHAWRESGERGLDEKLGNGHRVWFARERGSAEAHR